MLNARFPLRWRTGLTLVLAICIALVAGPLLLSRFASNIGLAMLNRAFTRQADVNAAAERWLQWATELDAENQAAWRGLGFVLAFQKREPEAVAAWQNAGLTAHDFVEWGEYARANAQYRTALIWYQRSLSVEPAAGMPRYYAGLVYEQLAEWDEALASYQQARQYADVRDVASSLYLRLGRIYQLHREFPDPSVALTLYDEAIAFDRFASVQDRIDTHFQRGEALQARGQLSEARQEFEWVVRQQPDHYWAHVNLGVLAWQEGHDVSLAETHLKQAIALQPGIKWAYRHLGLIYHLNGRYDEAIEMYRYVIAIDPSDAYVARLLRGLTRDATP